ncbi:hypothetical protein ABMY53_22555, partial [Vibrio vulnificus]
MKLTLTGYFWRYGIRKAIQVSIFRMNHNFTHSFVGGCNYVDDAFIFEDLYTLARLNKGKPVQI